MFLTIFTSSLLSFASIFKISLFSILLFNFKFGFFSSDSSELSSLSSSVSMSICFLFLHIFIFVFGIFDNKIFFISTFFTELKKLEFKKDKFSWKESLILFKDKFKLLSALKFSISDIIGFKKDNKNPVNSCLLLNESINFPKKVSFSKKPSTEMQHISSISFSNNLYINISTSSFSGFGIRIFS